MPLYQRLLDLLRSQIESGRYSVGDQLPTEHAMRTSFGVSRSTVRNALRALTDEGLIRPTPGVGTVVIRSRPPVQPSLLRGFTEDFARRGVPTQARVISAQIVDPPSQVRDRLELLPEEQVLHLVRLRLVSGAPLALMDNFVPASLGIGPEEDFTGPLYELIERNHKYYITYGRDAIGAATVRPEAASVLELPIGSPVLTIKRTAFIGYDRPIEYVEAIVRPDHYEYNVTLLRGKDAS
ncbi:MAG: GntR family transcriptional regulator [Gemmatimonadaceae bacterium]|nr:GntR family transcriptional regulator [Gemmatimonadaceae bacterium]